jgi:hypothetical protein
MKVTLTPEEAEKYFYNAMCNGLLHIHNYDVELTFSSDEYKQALSVLRDTNQTTCYEDVLMQMLRMGHSLTLEDTEGVVHQHSVTMKDVHERVQDTPIEHLSDMYYEQDDLDTADAILQTVFFKTIIFS